MLQHPRRLALGIVIALLLAPAAGLGGASGSGSQPNVIVGFTPGTVNTALIVSLGGIVTDTSLPLGLAGVYAADPASFITSVSTDPSVEFAETNDLVRAAVTGWDGTEWGVTGWDVTGWDVTGWDVTGWDVTGWDVTGWDVTGWDVTGWDGTGWAVTGWDVTGWDGSGWEVTGWDGSLWDQSWLSSRGSAQGSNGTDPLRPQQWGWHTVNSSEARAMASASGVKLCVVDSGVDLDHPDLAGALWKSPLGHHGRDFVDKDDDPSDPAGHGTHVAGIAAAVSGNGLGVAGASNARIVTARVLDANGAGTEFNLALGMQYCVEQGARVISLSLSTDQDSPAVRRAVKVAGNHGVVVVAASGNTGPSGAPRYPAAYDGVIAVGALLPDGTPAPFSSGGGHLDLAAPGFAIVSTLPNGGYGAFNGTSMAAPFVSGTVAMMLGANASLSPARVASILAQTAMDLGPSGHDASVGWGFVRADAAVAAAKAG